MSSNLKKQLLTQPQIIWLEALYESIKGNEGLSERELRIKLKGKIPNDFKPTSIRGAFLRGSRITLLGIALIDPNSEIIKNTNIVLQALREVLEKHPKTEEITVVGITKLTDLEEQTVANIFEDLSFLGMFHSAGTSYGLSGWASIRIDDRVFSEYFQFETIEAVIESFIDSSRIDSGKVEMKNEVDKKNVFVVHGRNWEARNALFTFLRSIGLHPLEWSEAVRATGKASPYVGEVLDTAFSVAQAIIVLMTPDDEARLLEQYRNEDDESYEVNLTKQARPNVLFEAGMAMGRNPDRTVLVELGKLRPFSDIGGRHVVRINGTTQKRQDLAHRLETAGCDVNLNGTDWHTNGDFDSALESVKKKNENDIAENVKDVAKTEFKLTPTFNFQCSRSPDIFNDQCSLNIKFKNEGTRFC